MFLFHSPFRVLWALLTIFTNNYQLLQQTRDNKSTTYDIYNLTFNQAKCILIWQKLPSYLNTYSTAQNKGTFAIFIGKYSSPAAVSHCNSVSYLIMPTVCSNIPVPSGLLFPTPSDNSVSHRKGHNLREVDQLRPLSYFQMIELYKHQPS